MTQMMMDDCKFFRSGISNAPSYCTALSVMECRTNKCSFYKPRSMNETDDSRKDKTKA
jgi:hypothetical protein